MFFFLREVLLIFLFSEFLLIETFLISSTRVNPRSTKLRGLEQDWINPSGQNLRKYLVSEMLHLLKGRGVPKPPNSLLDSCIFLCYKTKYTFSIHFNCPPSYLHTTKNTCVDTKKIVYKVLISRSPYALPLALLSGAELGSSGAPRLSSHCPACLSSALEMLQEKELAVPSSPCVILGYCGAALSLSLGAGRKQDVKKQ